MAAWVARPQQPAASMMARVDRLDLVLGYLEDMQRHHHRRETATTSRSSTATSSPSTTPASASSAASTPRGSKTCSTPRGSQTWRRRPVKEALEEAQTKGTLVDRIAFLEDRVLKMEEDMDIITPEKMTSSSFTMSGYSPRHDATDDRSSSAKKKKKGLKSLVKYCVTGNLKTKD
ncbi:unnamed protein product [Urochloa humidicola]